MAYYRFQGGTLTVTDGTTSSTIHTNIGGFLAATHSPGEAADIDRTNAASTRRRYKQGLADAGTFEVELQLDPEDPGQEILQTIKGSGVSRQFKWTLVGGKTLTFQGFVKSLSANAETEGDLTGTCRIRITGGVTRA